MNDDLPFSVEYAKSGRASCKKCKESIGKDVLRMAILIQSTKYDGKMTLWHHLDCFFQKKNSLRSITEIANFDNLRWEDQERIKKKLGGGGASNGGAGSSGSNENVDFSVENAKSSRSSCRDCGEKILKGDVRISKLDKENPAVYGFKPLWHHVDCFVKIKSDLGYSDTADKLPGFKDLSDEDKQMLKEKLGTQGVKRKAEEEVPSASKPKKVQNDDKNLKILRKQNEILFEMRDKLKKHFAKKDMVSLLSHNNQHISTGDSRLLDHLSDCMVFGALKECPDCKNARPRFLNNKYVCPGHLTEWTKCQYETKYPEREAFIVPDEFKEEFEFLKDYKYTKRERRFPEVAEASTSKKNLPLDDFKIVLFGKLKPSQIALEKKAKELGATVLKTITAAVNLCISIPAEIESRSNKVKKAEALGVHIVSPDFLDSVRQGSAVSHSIKEHLLCPWGQDPILKFGIKQEKGKQKSSGRTEDVYKSAPHKVKITVQGAAAVDPESGLEHNCHVYQKGANIYNEVLAYVDMSKGTNSFYKLQLLEANNKSKYYIFRQWGRVGTSIGGKKVEKYDGVEGAIKQFEYIFKDKTLNDWWDRKKFVKKSGGMYPLDIDYGQESEQLRQELKPGDNSKLPKPVQELVCLIFDIEAMKKAMVEFEIDLKKMPLGKLSKKQIELAYKVLCDAQQILVTGSNSAKITDVTNRFFTLIPHDFGMRQPPLLDDEEIIKSKIDMLDSLLEIEFAYSLLKSEHNDAKDPVDEHYEKLNTDINTVKKGSEEYKNIETYLRNTHAQTHNQYGLELEEVFKINRHGEDDRYKEFKSLHNKKLLWHGSRLTNYVGILSQGLRIAPPEAPSTGYMFGKGVYFADMVSKSANYCFTNKSNPTGILLLCEVALGDMYEKTNSEFIQKLPNGKHSTKGLGQTIPDPKKKTFVGDVEIPYGKPVPSNNRSVLLYNEYIVYDVNQVNIKYLLKVNFNWKW